MFLFTFKRVFEFVTNVRYDFLQKNGTASSGLLRAYTGVNDVQSMGQLISLDRKTKMNHWKTEECNEIK